MIVQFAVWLAASAIIVHILMWFMFALLRGRAREQAAGRVPVGDPAGSTAAGRGRGSSRNRRTRSTTSASRRAQLLDGYSWVDKGAGTVRIPVAEAMRLTLERGLPVAARGRDRRAAGRRRSAGADRRERRPGDGKKKAISNEPVMQNSEFRIQTRSRRASSRSMLARRVHCCILHSAFCITEISAQQQPGHARLDGVHRRASSASNVPPKMQDVTFKQRLGEQLPLDARFKDESGRDVALGDYFGKKPVVLAFVYYQCPMLCPHVMNGISSALEGAALHGRARNSTSCSSASIRATPRKRRMRRSVRICSTGRCRKRPTAGTSSPGPSRTIRRVTSAAGFTYQWDEETQQFAHVSGVLVVTPDGRLSRYFYGVEFSPKDLRLALVDSGQGRLGSVVEELLLYCFHYDPSTGSYGAVFMNILRLGGVLTVGLILGFVVLMRRRESRHVAERHA